MSTSTPDPSSASLSTDLNWKCINTIRLLSADMVEKAASGHPGAPMGLSPLAHVLFTNHMNFSPTNPRWINRDRFVLSNGHACALQYSMLHLLGYDMSMEDLQKFRQLDSKTPGHPEAHLTAGVETSTGPLGQGVSNAVGLALAAAQLGASFNRPDFDLINNYTFCIVGDGCLQEGVALEALSLAGHLKLPRLIFLYDSNGIQIDGSTKLCFTEDIIAHLSSLGFHTQVVVDGDSDLDSLSQAIATAKSITDRPCFIKINTTIGKYSTKQGTEKVHGSPLGSQDLKACKKALGFDENVCFFIPPQVKAFYQDFSSGLKAREISWNTVYSNYQTKYPELVADLNRRLAKTLPQDWKALLPRYSPSDPATATRKLSENVFNALSGVFTELIGGSADLTSSNLTKAKSALDFQCSSTGLGSYSGTYIRFGVREHAMGGICNGLAAYGSYIPFASTFLNFLSYAWGALRLSALSHVQVLYVMTHDSIGLGEDGPTHQPIEILASLRALPNILVLRPADGNEVSGSYAVALENKTRPSVLCLSRQNLPHLEGSSIENVYLGAYYLKQSSSPNVILIGTGSEVCILVEASQLLEKEHGLNASIISMPSWELFEEQSLAYKTSLFPKNIPVVSLEALSTFGWSKYSHYSIGMTTFGSSAPYQDIYNKLGFTPAQVVQKVLKVIEHFKTHPISDLIERPLLE